MRDFHARQVTRLVREGGDARWHLCLLVVMCCVGGAAALAGDDRPDDGDSARVAWRYTEKDLTVTIRQLGGKEWVAERSDGKRPIYDEIKRTDDSVELQNRDTKLFIRLQKDRAFWRRPKDEEWTTWVKGAWVEVAPAPAEPPPAPGEEPATTERKIRLAYFVPRDRKPTANYEQKIRVVMAIVAEVYQKDLQAKGHKTAGMRFETKENKPVVHLVTGEREARYYNNAPGYDADEQWRRLLPEIRAQVGNPQRQVIVVFTEAYDEGPAEHLWPGVIARGAYYTADGGLAVFSAHLLRDEFCALTVEGQKKLFFDETPVRGRKAWGQRMNSPRGTFAEDGVGAVAHELGHAVGLPHDRRDDARDIMGNGFRNLRWNYGGPAARRVGFSEDNARLLMSSRYLTGDLDLKDNQPPHVEVSPPTKGPQGSSVTVKASDNRGLRAIVFIDRTAGTVVAGRKLEGKTQEFRQQLPTMDGKSKDLQLQVIVTDEGGNHTRVIVGAPKGPASP